MASLTRHVSTLLEILAEVLCGLEDLFGVVVSTLLEILVKRD